MIGSMIDVRDLTGSRPHLVEVVFVEHRVQGPVSSPMEIICVTIAKDLTRDSGWRCLTASDALLTLTMDSSSTVLPEVLPVISMLADRDTRAHQCREVRLNRAPRVSG